MIPRNKKTLKINKNNDIESIIENFQQYEKKYEIKITPLEDGVQYKVKNMKIAQTYKSTILKTDINELTKTLKDKGKITVIIIDNIKNKKDNEIINEKIKKISKMKNVNTKMTSENKRYDVLESIIEGV